MCLPRSLWGGGVYWYASIILAYGALEMESYVPVDSSLVAGDRAQCSPSQRYWGPPECVSSSPNTTCFTNDMFRTDPIRLQMDQRMKDRRSFELLQTRYNSSCWCWNGMGKKLCGWWYCDISEWSETHSRQVLAASIHVLFIANSTTDCSSCFQMRSGSRLGTPKRKSIHVLDHYVHLHYIATIRRMSM